MDQTEVIAKVKRYAELVCSHFAIEKVVLYGSHARGMAGIDNDIDVAIVVRKMEKGFFEVEPLLWRLRREIDSLIEPVLVEEDNDPAGFLNEILKTGIIIYNSAA